MVGDGLRSWQAGEEEGQIVCRWIRGGGDGKLVEVGRVNQEFIPCFAQQTFPPGRGAGEDKASGAGRVRRNRPSSMNGSNGDIAFDGNAAVLVGWIVVVNDQCILLDGFDQSHREGFAVGVEESDDIADGEIFRLGRCQRRRDWNRSERR